MLFLQRLGPAVLPPRDVCVRMSLKVHLSIGFSFHACLSPSVVVPLLRIDEKQQSGSSSGRSSFSKVPSRLFEGFQAEDAETRCFLFASLPRDCVWKEATCTMARLYVCHCLDSVFSCKLSFFLFFFFPDNYVSPTPPPVCLMLSRIFNKKVTFFRVIDQCPESHWGRWSSPAHTTSL